MKIKSSDLKKNDIPITCKDWHRFSLFALSFDTTELNPMIIDEDELTSLGDKLSVEQIRAFLYLQQRRWNHFGRLPDEDVIDEINKLLIILINKCPD
ncbi:hypothetical protein GOZ93_17030 [Agrobacterium vitis]|uniref:hypothetical protein n=1 Tax=Agrobacterium vitis TaxID=373 RepID=UPI0012E76C31|nr:hypothetical protein [Agrobacterium vitis]MUZ83936.1 hypothetical protein [Agrobacterium vitis]